MTYVTPRTCEGNTETGLVTVWQGPRVHPMPLVLSSTLQLFNSSSTHLSAYHIHLLLPMDSLVGLHILDPYPEVLYFDALSLHLFTSQSNRPSP